MFSTTGKFTKTLITLLLATILLIVLSPLCFANSAEPPSIIIVVPNAPRDFDVTLNTHREEINAPGIQKFMETQFRFYITNYREGSEYSINVKYQGETDILEIGMTPDRYLNIYTLDHENMTLVKDTTGNRVWGYTVIRVILTLVIEALIFLFFGFRQKRSWVLFIVINLLTQGFLNIWLSTFSTVTGYLIFTLIWGEMFVFVAEIAGFLAFVKEHKKLRSFIYVIFANFASLLLGGYLITLMPM